MDLILIILRKLSSTRKKTIKKKNNLKTTPVIDFLDNTSLDTKIRKDLDLIEKNFDKISSAIETYG